MSQEPETNMMDQMQDIAEGLEGDASIKANEEEEKNEEEETNENKNEEEEEKQEQNGELDAILGNNTNALVAKEEEEEDKQEPIAVSEPKTTSETGSRRNKRRKNKPIDQDIEVVIPDLPFAPQPKDPNITHFIFEYEEDGVKRNSTRNGNTFSSRSKYQSTYQRGTPPANGGSLYDNSPYFSKPFTIYKVPKLPKTIRPNHTMSSRSKSTDRNLSSTQRSNYSNSTNGGYDNRSNCLSTSRRYSTRPPAPSNYLERTKEFDEMQRRYDAEVVEKYKLAHPLPIYQPHYQKTVLQMKIEKQRREERRYRKAAEEAKKKRIKNMKNHEEFIKKTETFENEGEKKPKYLQNLDKKHNYYDLDAEYSDEENQGNKPQRTHSKQSSKTNNTQNQSEKGELEDQVGDVANNLLGPQEEEEKKDNEEEEKEEGEEKEGGEKKEEEEKNEEEDKGELEEHIEDNANALLGSP
ncbi:hypothetical protein M9Y10_025788 [Tritrichomonas musculus]|uniref:Uncharacterized protein n=1 Tax=Tritrichomonas musculus TaxID=1915356 RepID=A0ABR2HAY1_9EUKA